MPAPPRCAAVGERPDAARGLRAAQQQHPQATSRVTHLTAPRGKRSVGAAPTCSGTACAHACECRLSLERACGPLRAACLNDVVVQQLAGHAQLLSWHRRCGDGAETRVSYAGRRARASRAGRGGHCPATGGLNCSRAGRRVPRRARAAASGAHQPAAPLPSTARRGAVHMLREGGQICEVCRCPSRRRAPPAPRPQPAAGAPARPSGGASTAPGTDGALEA